MKKKLALVVAISTVATMMFAGCGNTTTDTDVDTTEADTEIVTEAETEETVDEEAVDVAETTEDTTTEVETEDTTDDKAVYDITADMITTSLLYTVNDSQEAMILFTTASGVQNVLICGVSADSQITLNSLGEYTESVATDSDGLSWTAVSFNDTLSGVDCILGYINSETLCQVTDGDIVFEAESLTQGDAILYVQSALESYYSSDSSTAGFEDESYGGNAADADTYEVSTDTETSDNSADDIDSVLGELLS